VAIIDVSIKARRVNYRAQFRTAFHQPWIEPTIPWDDYRGRGFTTPMRSQH